MKIGFYCVDINYINYLKKIEIKTRGFTTVPNVQYTTRNKFLYGAVLEINQVNYFVPVSSYTKKQEDNIQIKVQNHHQTEIVGTLRFNYMIPVPKQCLCLIDFKDTKKISQYRKRLLEKEYRFCKKKRAVIQKQAKKTYIRVINKTDEELTKNSCDFYLLEEAYANYKKDC